MYSRSSIHVIGKISLAYSFFPSIHLGRCIECENYALQVKRFFETKEFAVNEIREAPYKSITERRINILI